MNDSAFPVAALARRRIRVVLVWHDYPAALQATTALVNDLDLKYSINGGELETTRDGECVVRLVDTKYYRQVRPYYDSFQGKAFIRVYVNNACKASHRPM